MGMATAYAALVSLMNLLNKIQLSCPVSFDKQQIQSLFDKASFLIDIFEDYCRGEIKETKGLERQITYAAYEVEDLIESYIIQQIRAESYSNRDICHALFFRDLRKAIQEIGFLSEELMKIKVKKGEDQDQFVSRPLSVGSLVHSGVDDVTVGLEEDVVPLMDQLTGHGSTRKISSVVGMGGIGKTTLAKKVYEHPFVINHFHVRCWVTISQHYGVLGIISNLLSNMGVHRSGNSTEQLGETLYKSLFGRKYLVVLDDIWDSVAWEEMRRFFPDNNNGSRILLTTRLSNVAVGVGSSCPYYEMKLLDDNKSWDLLSKKVFGEEVCPPELEKLGKQIAGSCKGLPLAIVVIGGLLKMSCNMENIWEDVAENVNSIINTENDEHCFKILSLSYSHLPVHLKPCFLYMATFSEDWIIKIPKLIRLWVSEGFLKPIVGKTLEEVAREYLNDLIDRNLIMVEMPDTRGRARQCILHDLLKDFCLREAQKERFLCVINNDTLSLPLKIKSERRSIMIKSERRSIISMRSGHEVIPLPSTVRSLTSNFPFTFRFRCSLLRVLHTHGPYNHKDILQLVNLRCYSSFYHETKFSSMSLMWNLETVDLRELRWNDIVILPSEIWELRHLRHVIIRRKAILSDPVGKHTLNNLQTMTRITDFSCSDEILNRIPNLKKLGIHYDMKKVSRDVIVSSCFKNLSRFHKLETLQCQFFPEIKKDDVARFGCKCVFNDIEIISLPACLKKLGLYESNIPWEYMTIVGSLPNLEELNLRNGAFSGEEWNTTDGEFKRLKYLSIQSCPLITWKAESSHFPRLERLVLRHMYKLEGIPRGIGEVMSLKSIFLYLCSSPVVISAKNILEEQQSQGNDELQIEVWSFKGSEQCALADDNPRFLIRVVGP